MTPPPIDGALARDQPEPFDDRPRLRFKLARRWAYALAETAYLPWPHHEVEQRLAGLLDGLIDAVAGQPFSARRAEEVGARLVEWRCTDPASLRRCLDVLGSGLLALPELSRVDGIAKRVIAVSGALAAAYSDAMRLFTIEQQENLNLALVSAKHNLLTSEARFDQVAASSASGIAITDLDGRFVRTNTALERILGSSAADLAGVSLFDVVQLDRADLLPELYQDLLHGPTDRLRQVGRLLRKDDGTARVALTASLLRSVDGVPNQFVTVVEDATELTLLQDELLRQSLHDVLTGLPNRQYFTTRLESLLHNTHHVVGVTLYHVAVDAFPMIAAGLGLPAADRLLVAVAERLRTIVDGQGSMLARFGGNEFGILVADTSGRTVPGTVDGINDVIAEPIVIDGRGVAVSLSIGVVHQPPEGLSPIELLCAADMTLRRAQRGGPGRCELFDPAQDARERETARLALDLPGAWRDGELLVVYRPLVRLADGHVTGLSALLRWDHPETGVLDHARCVELAEQAGLTVQLGQWLLRSACAQLAEWAALATGVTVHVDLTPHQSANPDLVGAILRTLDETGVGTDRIRCTVPVRALSGDDESIANLRLMSDVGIGTGLHDFGAGPADLALLADLPVSSVRLTGWRQPFGVTSPEGDVLTALTAAVHGAGAELIVDGVRNARQAAWWRRAGADTAQGPFPGPAAPAGDVAGLLDGR
jgi:diguanylate cyclase (GGDEF)-like protein/PAS domain S-box-containing protein